MSFDFGSVLSATQERMNGSSGGPTIVHQEHDTSKVNWVRGVTDPGEMVGCGMYQELRRHDGESDDAYQARLVVLLANLPAQDRERIEAGMRPAALKRASLDTTGGIVRAFYGSAKPAWHGLGTTIEGTASSAEAMALAHLDRHIERIPLTFNWGGNIRECPDRFALVYSDTGKLIASCGPTYRVIQNKDIFRFVDRVLDEFGAKYEAAGSLYDGEQVFVLAHLPQSDFNVNGSTMKAYACFLGYHVPGVSDKVFGTNLRVECANTSALALSDAGASAMRIRHTGNILGVVQPTDLRVIVGPDDAILISQAPELVDYVKQQPSAVQLVEGGWDPQYTKWGLPRSYKGFEFVVEDSPIVDVNPNVATLTNVADPLHPPEATVTTGAPGRHYMWPKGTAIMCSRVGALEGEYGAPSFSTIQVFHYGGLLEVKAFDDPQNERVKGRVQEYYIEKIVSNVSGYRITVIS